MPHSKLFWMGTQMMMISSFSECYLILNPEEVIYGTMWFNMRILSVSMRFSKY